LKCAIRSSSQSTVTTSVLRTSPLNRHFAGLRLKRLTQQRWGTGNINARKSRMNPAYIQPETFRIILPQFESHVKL
jgi:hypothetical protein